jgi:hypothetical protein
MGSPKSRSNDEKRNFPESVLGMTLAERKLQGNQAERRRAYFASLKETEGPRAGLTKIGNYGISVGPPEEPTTLAPTAEAVATPKPKRK